MQRGDLILNGALVGALAAVAAIPLANPDLFWHLEAGRAILVEGVLPRFDAMSFTRYGEAWVNFEWLLQLFYLGIYSLGGWSALWALKAVLFAMNTALVWALLQLTGAPLSLRRAGLFAWAAMMLLYSELKPVQFSELLFCVLLWVLESARLGRLEENRPWVWGLGGFLLFALWANLHPGYPMGFILLGCWSLGGGKPGAARLAAAVLGGLLGVGATPYGYGMLGVFAQHMEWMPMLSGQILEWKPPRLGNPYQFPLWVACAFAAGFCLDAWRRGRLIWPHAAAAAAFGLFSLMHTRHGAFFAPVSLFVVLSARPPVSLDGAARRVLEGAWAAACVVFIFWLALPDLRAGKAFDDRMLPVAAAEFIDAHRSLFRKRRFFNEWGWGGYLSYRFRGDLKVYMDGRYLFHPTLDMLNGARRDPVLWRELLDRDGVEWAMVHNRPRPLALTLRPREGADMTLRVEHFETFFPRYAWGLVHQDPVARVYVRKGSFPRAWVESRERRFNQR